MRPSRVSGWPPFARTSPRGFGQAAACCWLWRVVHPQSAGRSTTTGRRRQRSRCVVHRYHRPDVRRVSASLLLLLRRRVARSSSKNNCCAAATVPLHYYRKRTALPARLCRRSERVRQRTPERERRGQCARVCVCRIVTYASFTRGQADARAVRARSREKKKKRAAKRKRIIVSEEKKK